MTVENGASLDNTETAIDSAEIPAAEEEGPRPAGEASARLGRLAAIRPCARRCLTSWLSIVATTFVVAAVVVAA
ncbi:MAG: hypothetical protein QOE30_4251, partial [Mycobacterium sp.]|nr:hypothetical protein [Mycobacterium sp.]